MTKSAGKPERAKWIDEAARKIWPYAGLEPLQTGDSMRNEIAKIIAEAYARSGDGTPPETAERIDDLCRTIIQDVLSGKDQDFILNRTRARINMAIGIYMARLAGSDSPEQGKPPDVEMQGNPKRMGTLHALPHMKALSCYAPPRCVPSVQCACVPCPKCEGLGAIRTDAANKPAWDSETCGECGGSGEAETCAYCRGAASSQGATSEPPTWQRNMPTKSILPFKGAPELPSQPLVLECLCSAWGENPNCPAHSKIRAEHEASQPACPECGSTIRCIYRRPCDTENGTAHIWHSGAGAVSGGADERAEPLPKCTCGVGMRGLAAHGVSCKWARAMLKRMRADSPKQGRESK